MKTVYTISITFLSEFLLALALISLVLPFYLLPSYLVSQQRGSQSLAMYVSTWRTRKRFVFRKSLKKLLHLPIRMMKFVGCVLSFPSYCIDMCSVRIAYNNHLHQMCRNCKKVEDLKDLYRGNYVA